MVLSMFIAATCSHYGSLICKGLCFTIVPHFCWSERTFLFFKSWWSISYCWWALYIILSYRWYSSISIYN